jgi:hypothetical protein
MSNAKPRKPRAGIFSRISGLIGDAAPVWHPADRPYPSLFDLARSGAQLQGKGGVYLVWHLGVRPRWLRAGQAGDLGQSFSTLAAADVFVACRVHGGVFASWCFASAEQRPGIVRFLAERLRPALQDVIVPGEPRDETAAAISFSFPPGTQALVERSS